MVKGFSPARQRVSLPSGRYALIKERTALSQARAATTRAIKRGEFTNVQGRGGQNLKYSVEKMGERLNASQEQMNALRDMDPDKLQALYDNNKFIFDVFFSYGNVEGGDDFYSLGPGADDQINDLITEYSRAFGGT